MREWGVFYAKCVVLGREGKAGKVGRLGILWVMLFAVLWCTEKHEGLRWFDV